MRKLFVRFGGRTIFCPSALVNTRLSYIRVILEFHRVNIVSSLSYIYYVYILRSFVVHFWRIFAPTRIFALFPIIYAFSNGDPDKKLYVSKSESGGKSRPLYLAERYKPCDLVAEREHLYSLFQYVKDRFCPSGPLCYRAKPIALKLIPRNPQTQRSNPPSLLWFARR